MFLTNIESSTDNNKVAIVSFKDSATTISGFSNDYSSLKSKINSLSSSSDTRSIASGLEEAYFLINSITDKNAEKSVVLFTTGYTNTGDYNYNGHFDSSVVASNWHRINTGVKFYAYANSAFEKVNQIEASGTLVYTIGLFQTYESMPTYGKDVVSFLKLTAKELASFDSFYYEVDNVDNLEFTFGKVADTIALTESNGMRLVINNTSLSYTVGDYVIVAASNFNNDVESKIEKLSAKSSNSSILKMIQIYDTSNFPSYIPFAMSEEFKKCKFIIFEAVSDGDAYVSVTNSGTGETRFIPFTINKKDIVSIRRIDNLKTWDLGDGDTYVGSACGLYIESIAYQKSGDYFLLTMDIYNKNHCPGIIEVYDGSGKLVGLKTIEKFKSFDTGILKTFKSGYVIVKEAFQGKTFSYKSEKLSKKTSISKLKVPKDGYIKITCDYETSAYCALANLIDSVFTAVSLTKSIGKIASGIGNDFNEKEIDKLKNAFFNQLLKDYSKNEEIIKKFAKKFAEKLAKSSAKKFDLNTFKDDCNDIINDGLPAIEEMLENMGLSLDDIFKAAFGSAVSVSEGVLTKIMGGYGIVINSLFAAENTYDFVNQLYDMNNLPTGIPAFVGYMPANTETTVIKNEEVMINTKGNAPIETVLESYRIVYGNKNDINLSTGEVYSEYEEYEIALVKDGQYIQPSGPVEVGINSPYEKAIVVRQKSDGSWEKIDSKLENGTLFFSVDHFCRFAVIEDDNTDNLTFWDYIAGFFGFLITPFVTVFGLIVSFFVVLFGGASTLL